MLQNKMFCSECVSSKHTHRSNFAQSKWIFLHCEKIFCKFLDHKISLDIQDWNDISHTWMHTIATMWRINLLSTVNLHLRVQRPVSSQKFKSCYCLYALISGMVMTFFTVNVEGSWQNEISDNHYTSTEHSCCQKPKAIAIDIDEKLMVSTHWQVVP